MNSDTTNSLAAQLAAIALLGSGAKLRKALMKDGPIVFETVWRNLDEQSRDASVSTAEKLSESGISTISILDADYPIALNDLAAPPPFLFVKGNRNLLGNRGIGMCGSRNVPDRGLLAAATCARKAAQKRISVISGYARGVDIEAHRESLRAGGATVIVLAEGISRFRIKRMIEPDFDWDRVLVLSQFAPNAAWSPGNAMNRNGIIAALGEILVVVDAGATGGTINAGRQGIATGRRVVAIDYSHETPSGTRQLISEGATAINTAGDFERLLDHPRNEIPVPTNRQSAMF